MSAQNKWDYGQAVNPHYAGNSNSKYYDMVLSETKLLVLFKSTLLNYTKFVEISHLKQNTIFRNIIFSTFH